MDDSKALNIVSRAGHIMLENGAEISRVEEVMERIAHAFGVDSGNFFVLSNGIFTTAQGYANVEHIPFHGTQLDRVVAVNQLSREIVAGKVGLEQAQERLDEIRRMPARPSWEQVLGSALGSGAFCAIFGGDFADCGVAFLSGIFLWFFVLRVSFRYMSKVTANIASGAFAALFCIISFKLLGWGNHLGNMLIGAVIPLIPGVPFTNGIRDLASEDYIAGATRLIDALMGFMCIALGVVTVLIVDSYIGGSMIVLDGTQYDPVTAQWPWQLLAAFVGTMSFAVLFGAPRSKYVGSGVCGLLGWIAYLAATRFASLSPTESTLLATMVVTLSAYRFAVWQQCPVIVFLICGIFPLVPGAGVFWTSYHIVSQNLPIALQTGFLAAKCTFAIAFAIIIVTELSRMASRNKK